jgi:hypothetical protein
MRSFLLTTLASAALVSPGLLNSSAVAQDASRQGLRVGTLSCTVEGGIGLVFGSDRPLDCILTRDGSPAEHYKGSVRKFGLDVGFTREARIMWLVFSAGEVGQGAISGDYFGVTAGASLGAGAGVNYLVGGSTKQITLQPFSVESKSGVNIAAGIGQVTLQSPPTGS